MSSRWGPGEGTGREEEGEGPRLSPRRPRRSPPPAPQDCRGAPRPLWALPACYCLEVSPGTQHSALHAPGSPRRAVTRVPPTPCLVSCLHTCGMHGNDSLYKGGDSQPGVSKCAPQQPHFMGGHGEDSIGAQRRWAPGAWAQGQRSARPFWPSTLRTGSEKELSNTCPPSTWSSPRGQLCT